MKHFYLTPVLGGPGAPRYPIAEEPRLIGRSERAAIALLEPTVSREHAAVQIRDGVVFLEDLGSKHGTFVNSKRVNSAKLKVGDIIVFGLSLVLRLEESDSPVAMTPVLDAGIPSQATPQVKTIEPLPDDRHAETQVTTFDAIDSQTPRPVRDEQIERMFDQLAKTRKLAATGAYCATILPDVHQQLGELIDLLENEQDITQEMMIEPLRQLQDEMSALLRTMAIASGPQTPVNLFDVVRRAVSQVKPFASPNRVELLVGVPADLFVVAAAAPLEAAISEVLRNAAAASPNGEVVEINAVARPRSVILTITDLGDGIPGDVFERIFDPFFTLRNDRIAVGLGLYEARQLVLSCGGKLSMESGRGKTTATISLPRAQR